MNFDFNIINRFFVMINVIFSGYTCLNFYTCVILYYEIARLITTGLNREVLLKKNCAYDRN